MAHTAQVNAKAIDLHDSRGSWVIFSIGFSVFLMIALVGQLLGLHWRSWLPGAEGVKSIFGGVKAAVYTFMSHIL